MDATVPFTYTATLVKITDGDTCQLTLTKTWELDFGFDFKTKHTDSLTVKLRFYGFNCPEVHDHDPALAARGKAAQAALADLLSRGTLRVESVKLGKETKDRYGRYLARVFVKPVLEDEFEIGPRMIELGHALPYFGEGVKPV